MQPATQDGASTAQAQPTKAWLLVIQSEFQSVEDRDALISHVKAVAVESACNEPQTLGFQIAIADNNPLRILILERFASKDHWLEPHKESRAFKELKAWQGASGIQVTTTGQSYNETDIGYLTPGERGLMQQQAASGTQ